MHVTFRKFEALEYVLRAYDKKIDAYGRITSTQWRPWAYKAPKKHFFKRWPVIEKAEEPYDQIKQNYKRRHPVKLFGQLQSMTLIVGFLVLSAYVLHFQMPFDK